MTAYGYIRKSVVHDAARMLSPEMQEDAIRTLAAAHGDDDVVILTDLDLGPQETVARTRLGRAPSAVVDGDGRPSTPTPCRGSRAASPNSPSSSTSATSSTSGSALTATRSTPLPRPGPWSGTSSPRSRSSRPTWRASASRTPSRPRPRRTLTGGGPGQPVYGERAGEDVGAVLDGLPRARGPTTARPEPPHERGRPLPGPGSRCGTGTVVRAIVQAPSSTRRDPPDPWSRGARAGKRAFRFSLLIRCSTCEARGVRAGSKANTFPDWPSWDPKPGATRSATLARGPGSSLTHASWVNEAKLLPPLRQGGSGPGELRHPTAQEGQQGRRGVARGSRGEAGPGHRHVHRRPHRQAGARPATHRDRRRRVEAVNAAMGPAHHDPAPDHGRC